MVNALKRFWKDEEGATMVEYAILVAIVSVSAIIILGLLRDQIVNAFDDAQNAMSTADTGAEDSVY